MELWLELSNEIEQKLTQFIMLRRYGTKNGAKNKLAEIQLLLNILKGELDESS